MELVRGTNKTEIKNAHRQEHIRSRRQDTPQAEICPEQAAERTQAGTYPEQAEEHQQEAAERSQAEICPEEAAGYSTGRDMSGGGSRILHRQEYTAGGSRRQQETPQVTHRQEYTGGDSRT